jgi:hypothetical protein
MQWLKNAMQLLCSLLEPLPFEVLLEIGLIGHRAGVVCARKHPETA